MLEFVSSLWGIETHFLCASTNYIATYGLYPAYEVLKRGCYGSDLYGRVFCLYPAYEVLKLNDIYTFCEFVKILFVSSLWGIETINENNIVLFVYLVCIQPMRYWNGTCRNLGIVVISFVSSLWGIETSIFLQICFDSAKFVSSLWGIETAI